MYYPDYGPETSAPDIGDSAILELVGLGGAAAAGFTGGRRLPAGRMADAVTMTERMASICVGREHPVQVSDPELPGDSLGVDVRRVVELDTTPRVTTGILHASSGVGQIGAGVATAPIECFRAALRSLAPDATSG